MRKDLITFITLVGILMLSGCGFHLKGQIVLPDYLGEPHVKGNDLELVRGLEKALVALGSVPQEKSSSSSSILELRQVSYLREVSSLDHRGKVRGYILKFEVVYRLITPDLDILVEDTVLTLSRNLDYNPGEVLQLQREESLIRAEMVNELAQRIVKRVLTLSEVMAGPISADSWEVFKTSLI